MEGLVKLSLGGEKGEEIFLYYLEKGDACALSIINKTNENDIKAMAMSNTKIIVVPVEHMDAMIRTFPRWYYFLLESYHLRLCEMLKTLHQVVFHSMDEKLAIYLRQQFSAWHSDTINTTHSQIALDLNSSREVISRLLKKMESDDLISLDRNEIKNVGLDEWRRSQD